VLTGGGALYEYDGSSGAWSYLAVSVSAISAGTDRYGINMVDVVSSTGAGWELSLATGWHLLAASGVVSVSAGGQGNSEVLVGITAYAYTESTGALTYQASGVGGLSAGMDASGNPMADLVLRTGAGLEWRAGIGWTSLGNNLQAISKGKAGLVDLVFSGGLAYEHTAAGNVYLDIGVRVAV
jgi:hypothetical protein